MKPNPIATRALAGMLPAMALFATSASAQEAAQPAPPTAPPVVEAPVAQPASPAATVQAPPAAPTGPSAEDRAKLEASATAATGTAAAPAEAAPAQPAARRATTRPAPRVAARAAAPAAAVTAPAPAAPVNAPSPTAVAPAEPAVTALPDAPMTTPVPETTEPAVTATDIETTATTDGGVPLWGWALGVLALLAVVAAVMFARRRREEPVWDDQPVAAEPVYAEPTYVEPVAAPAAIASAAVAAAPLTHEAVAEDHAEVVAPAADEVAAITAASAPVTGRPWIELSLRPVRAGTTEDSALVDLELTLANAGEVAARDVRVSTFMLGDGSDAPTDMDRLLANGQGGTEVSTGDLGAGEGSRVDASLAVPRDGLDGATFQPIVVADVRYTLPDGGEGRTAAAFAVGVDDGTDDPTPFRLGGDVREDVSATLYGVPERA